GCILQQVLRRILRIEPSVSTGSSRRHPGGQLFHTTGYTRRQATKSSIAASHKKKILHRDRKANRAIQRSARRRRHEDRYPLVCLSPSKRPCFISLDHFHILQKGRLQHKAGRFSGVEMAEVQAQYARIPFKGNRTRRPPLS